ncbi:mannose-1-phosphate guanylyltransferase/mannose-6-phosphate isomerase [Aestuariivirga sp.]|uniref:mannose-1-phosphate guanylyltransferase/mannose-6-phosphate isomerase n=1 Tax=Aestuariivirga sp. TaxID=2650926 RepID=UPI0039E42742
MAIHPVILCGGSGTRLWPLSRKSYPKQFANLVGEGSLFQQTVRRLSGENFARPVIITAADFRFIVTEQLAAIGVTPEAILIEPEPRNTAPAVLAAALWLEARDPQALMLVAPSDHAIGDDAKFRAAVTLGTGAAASNQIVTFGITPTRAETGYGYLEPAEGAKGGVRPLRRFVEKPEKPQAEAMLASGRYLWNAGIFLFSVSIIVNAFAREAPAILAAVKAAVSRATSDLAFTRLDPQAWSSATAISIDHAIMEKAQNLSVVDFDGAWSDLGGWDAVWTAAKPDETGTATSGNATAIACRDTLLRSESENIALVGIGLEDMIAVAMRDAVLVAPLSRAQDVKLAVAALREKSVPQAETSTRDHRPWGTIDRLASGEGFAVRRITVNPHAALSLQSHQHRAEHWIIISGEAEVTADDITRTVSANQSLFIPPGARHRLANRKSEPLVLIEVRTGDYLGEDDVTRYA